MNRFDIAGLLIAILGIGLIWSTTELREQSHEVPATVLIGSGCEGPSYFAVATEEDLLPRCVTIERHEVMTRKSQ